MLVLNSTIKLRNEKKTLLHHSSELDAKTMPTAA